MENQPKEIDRRFIVLLGGMIFIFMSVPLGYMLFPSLSIVESSILGFTVEMSIHSFFMFSWMAWQLLNKKVPDQGYT